MRRAVAWGLLALLAAVTAAALLAPLAALAAMALGALLLLRERRGLYLAFAAVSLPVNVVLLALIVPTGEQLALGPVALGSDGAVQGLAGGLRLLAAMGLNLALLSRVGAARLLDGLGLPARATSLLAAILLAAQDVGRDFERLRTARRLDGAWPEGRLARAREAARLLPALMLGAHRRAATRREALRLAGHDTAPWFVPLVAVAALAAAGRLALLAFPNVALTYVVAFLGGILFGPWIAAGGAFLGMTLTDFLLTGLYPAAFVNAPAMALLGLLGGALRWVDFDGRTRADRAAGVAIAASVGIGATFLFSLAADSLTWLLLYRATPAAWLPMAIAGLAFNVLPALVNGALFAASVTPTVRAFRAAREGARGRSPRGEAAPEPPATTERPAA